MSHLLRVLSLLALAGVFAGCKNGNSDPAAARLGPRAVGTVSIAANPNPAVPLAAVVAVTSDVPTQVDLRISDGTHTWSHTADATFRTVHDRVPVLGMRPAREHTVTVTLRDQGGRTTVLGDVLRFTTPALPADFPPLQVTASNPGRMEYGQEGVTLLTLFAQPGSFLIMLDPIGDVVWYLACNQIPFVNQAMTLGKPMPDGNFMLIVDPNNLLLEVDRLGDVRTAWWAANLTPAPAGTVPVAIDSFHHDILALPAGSGADFAVLGTELRVLPDYPTSETDPLQTEPSANVIGDTVVEFNRDGTVVRQVKMLDVLDPYRVSYDFLSNFWDVLYGRSTRDWSHANGLAFDAAEQCYLVSMRQQDAVIKVGRNSALHWILGDHGRWTAPWDQLLLSPLPGTEFQYHQHAPLLAPDGSIYVFDNGCGRAVPPATRLTPPNCYSRAVQFRVDGQTRTVEQQWEYGPRPGRAGSYYSFFISSAFPLATTGNVLVCDGGRMELPSFLFHARIAEVTHTTPAEILFEVWIRDTAATPVDYSVYRAYRLPNAYD